MSKFHRIVREVRMVKEFANPYECTKFRYNKKQAEDFLNAPKKKQYQKQKRMYFCKDCNAWHLTSKDDWMNPVELEEVRLSRFRQWKRILKQQ